MLDIVFDEFKIAFNTLKVYLKKNSRLVNNIKNAFKGPKYLKITKMHFWLFKYEKKNYLKALFIKRNPK
jgi:hypothetical protein